MSKPIHQEIHSLYRSYLRVAREWPEDKLRPNRGMKQILAMRVKETFRKPNDEIDLNLALKEIESLEALLDNTFKDKYPLSDKTLTPAGHPEYYSKLVASLEASLETSKSRNKGLLAKLFS